MEYQSRLSATKAVLVGICISLLKRIREMTNFGKIRKKKRSTSEDNPLSALFSDNGSYGQRLNVPVFFT
ncbi:MAG: hypothetical protein RBG13Loki_0468 [Promethearchaeota archaeon CR_4]|nr:MAG: hypothetical protein RBG13Loki_0468 [Candidatus Lokiarchaeota archaeon CR_4]